MVSTEELRIILFYEFKLRNNAANATRNINYVFGDGTVTERTVQRWFEKFRFGENDLKNKPRGKPPVLVDDDVLREIVEADPSRTLSSIAEELGVCSKTIGNHLKKMGKVKKLDKWVPLEKNNL